MQNFYSQETAPHQAIHLALDTGVEEGQKAMIKEWSSRKVRTVLNLCPAFPWLSLFLQTVFDLLEPTSDVNES